MALRQLRIIGDEILHKKSRKVDTVTERILTILDDMVETMYANNGLGLAGVQVGVLRCLVVIDVGQGPLRLINPEIVQSEGEESDIEGCLSIPGYQGTVKRPQKITVRYMDTEGETVEVEAEGLFKKALCHEIDHLSGILYNEIADSFYEIPPQKEEETEDAESEGEEGVDTTEPGAGSLESGEQAASAKEGGEGKTE